MPAPVIVVHDEAITCDVMLSAIRAAGHEAREFHDPMAALNAIEADTRMRVLVTRIDFGRGKLGGLALFRMLHHKRRGIKAVFVGEPDDAQYVGDTGEFLPHPVDCAALADTVGLLLNENG